MPQHLVYTRSTYIMFAGLILRLIYTHLCVLESEISFPGSSPYMLISQNKAMWSRGWLISQNKAVCAAYISCGEYEPTPCTCICMSVAMGLFLIAILRLPFCHSVGQPLHLTHIVASRTVVSHWLQTSQKQEIAVLWLHGHPVRVCGE